jgi:hypothetical protein
MFFIIYRFYLPFNEPHCPSPPTTTSHHTPKRVTKTCWGFVYAAHNHHRHHHTLDNDHHLYHHNLDNDGDGCPLTREVFLFYFKCLSSIIGPNDALFGPMVTFFSCFFMLFFFPLLTKKFLSYLESIYCLVGWGGLGLPVTTN